MVTVPLITFHHTSNSNSRQNAVVAVLNVLHNISTAFSNSIVIEIISNLIVTVMFLHVSFLLFHSVSFFLILTLNLFLLAVSGLGPSC